jgi:hypothetical protein
MTEATPLSIAGHDLTDEIFTYPDPTDPSRMRRVPAREATLAARPLKTYVGARCAKGPR